MMNPKGESKRSCISGMMHVNINCSDFERSREFYEKLGFKVLMSVPPKGKGDIARAVGFDAYILQGALMALPDGSLIDLLEWKKPRSTEEPYKELNNLGLARLALHTRNLDRDMENLRSLGVEFLSEPALVAGFAGRSRFVCFRDPDGTFIELIETGAAVAIGRRITQWFRKQPSKRLKEHSNE